VSGGTILFGAIVCGIISMLIGQKKNFKMPESFLLGALLGIIGIVIMLVRSPQLPKAPAGMIAVKCSRCNAVSNVPLHQDQFECWQCKNSEPMSKAVLS
jgi:hypothetical protein